MGFLKNFQNVKEKSSCNNIVITAGSSYLDIDAYACCIALKELLELCSFNVVAYSNAKYNYSICNQLINEDKMLRDLPSCFVDDRHCYIIVDVSDPSFLDETVKIEDVIAVYDHHVGFEEYWRQKIGENSHIEFVGAAATLIVREWKRLNLFEKMSRDTALLLVAAILDNTLNLTSSNTTEEDICVFNELFYKENLDKKWIESYFNNVQVNIENDLRNALLKDIKKVSMEKLLPANVAQITIWSGKRLLEKISSIKKLLNEEYSYWMINIIDIENHCSYFVCEDKQYQRNLENVFHISFNNDIAKTVKPYLRKEIIKTAKLYLEKEEKI